MLTQLYGREGAIHVIGNVVFALDAVWLEDAGIPARVIDELMGHQRSRHGALEGGSRIGARYCHTTDAMALRVVEAIQERLTTALRVAEQTQADQQGTRRMF